MRKTALAMVTVVACGSSHAAHTDGAAGDGTAGCTLTANTTETATVTSGCALRSRDTSSCHGRREAGRGWPGSGHKFSCRVTLTLIGELGRARRPTTSRTTNRTIFPTTNACHIAYTTDVSRSEHDQRAALSPMTVPMSPAGSSNRRWRSGRSAWRSTACRSSTTKPRPATTSSTKSGFVRSVPRAPADAGRLSLSHRTVRDLVRRRCLHRRDARRKSDRRPTRSRWQPRPLSTAIGGHTAVTVDSPSVPCLPLSFESGRSSTSPARPTGQSAWFLTTGTYAKAPGACTGC